MRIIKFSGIIFLSVFILYNFLFRKTICVLSNDERLTISTVESGTFSEFIPVTGILLRDTIANTIKVQVSIDEMYLPRVATGLKATAEKNGTIFSFEVTEIHPALRDGRFHVVMSFIGEVPIHHLESEKSLRLRLELSKPVHAMLLPVGGFYYLTKGNWVFVVQDGDRAVRRKIKLGRKNTEYFEVLEGLSVGDRVITSSYEEFHDQESLDLNEFKQKLHEPVTDAANTFRSLPWSASNNVHRFLSLLNIAWPSISKAA